MLKARIQVERPVCCLLFHFYCLIGAWLKMMFKIPPYHFIDNLARCCTKIPPRPKMATPIYVILTYNSTNDIDLKCLTSLTNKIFYSKRHFIMQYYVTIFCYPYPYKMILDDENRHGHVRSEGFLPIFISQPLN